MKLIYMRELEIGLADESELNFDRLSCSLMERKKDMRRVLLDLNLNAEY